ncbi:MAG TPA: response regulator [Elusimicrobia bacterium]|jgi:DNA-binding NarL/FixJ family response regulator|nr:response regulator [Elusimicrobiota bacterium]
MMKVFIMDDSQFLRERLIGMLADIYGVEVVCQAKDLPETIESIQQFKPDMVIMDIKTSKGNRIDMLKNIKGNKRIPFVVIFTNYSSAEYRRKCIELGADFFFDKSMEFEKLVEVLKQLPEYSKLNQYSGMNVL